MKIQILLVLQALLVGSFAQLVWNSSLSNISLGTSGMTFYYHFNEANKSVFMGLDMPASVGYFAIGFAPKDVRGMQQLDIAAFTFNFNKTTGNYEAAVEDHYASKTGPPPTDFSLGGTDDYFILDHYVGSALTQIQFVRKLDTGDKFDFMFDVQAVGKDGLSISYAWLPMKPSDNVVAYHGNNRGVIPEATMANKPSSAETAVLREVFHL